MNENTHILYILYIHSCTSSSHKFFSIFLLVLSCSIFSNDMDPFSWTLYRRQLRPRLQGDGVMGCITLTRHMTKFSASDWLRSEISPTSCMLFIRLPDIDVCVFRILWILWWCIATNLLKPTFAVTLRNKSCHDTKYSVIGGTDNVWCHLWTQRRHHNSSLFPVKAAYPGFKSICWIPHDNLISCQRCE